MELYQLRTFVAVAEEGNVTRAAERLCTSQPAVSGHIKALEQEFGLPLFTRTPSGMALTEAGRRMLNEAREALQRAQRVEDLARHLRDGTAGVLRIALNSPAERIPIEQITQRLTAAHPDLQVHVSVGRSVEIARAIKNYEVDVGFAEGPLDPAMHRHMLGEVEVCIAAPAAWAGELAGDDWTQLNGKPWIFSSPDCSQFQLFQQLIRDRGLSFQQQFRIDEYGMTLQFVRSGLAMSLLDRQLAEDAAARGEVFIWPHFRASMPHHAIALSRRIDEVPIAAFFEVCRELYPRTGGSDATITTGARTARPRRKAV